MIVKASGRSALISSNRALCVFRGAVAGGAEATTTAAAASKSDKRDGAPIALNKYTKPRHSKKSRSANPARWR